MSNYQEWMWYGALQMLARTEQQNRQPSRQSLARSRLDGWEPPVDVIETEREVVVIAALPGVAAAEVEAVIEGACLIIAGSRPVPAALGTVLVHRMELPRGRFERRIVLPRGVYDRVSHRMVDGCLVISLSKRE